MEENKNDNIENANLTEKMSTICKEFNNSDYIELMNVYLTEWGLRDSHLWKQLYTYFYAVVILSMLPHLKFIDTSALGYGRLAFPILGIVMTIFFFIVANGFSIRLFKVSKIYKKLIENLPENLQREQVKGIFNIPMAHLIAVVMSLSLICVCALSIILILV